MAGLHALERLANNHSAPRQTIVDVICAYLRMPYPADKRHDLGSRMPVSRNRAQAARSSDEEHEVRLAAQRILTRHLQRTLLSAKGMVDINEYFWPNISIDLSNAVLIDFSLLDGVLSNGIFSGATFVGDTLFDRSTFGWEAWFDGARFESDAGFDGVTFRRFAAFDDAVFAGSAGFVNARFKRDAQFDGATFVKDAVFDNVQFGRDARFIGIIALGAVAFKGTVFGGHAWFTEANFDGLADFSDSYFTGRAIFNDVGFQQTTFAWTRFAREARFDDVTALDVLDLNGAMARQWRHHCWPEGWMLDPRRQGGAEGSEYLELAHLGSDHCTDATAHQPE